MKTNEIATQIDAPQSGERLVLHACCGPCTLEPYKILRDAGWDITIMYSNSNIFPKGEFEHRFATLEK